MFELELIELLNNLKKSDSDYNQNKIKQSISKLITENNEKFNKFIHNGELDDETISLLNECAQGLKEDKRTDESNDFQIVKRYYEKWLEAYNSNDKIPNEVCEKIILDLINFYITSRFEVLKQVLSMNDSTDFESFKNMLKNYIRKYYAQKIESYYTSHGFESLGFFDKRKKKKEIIKILDDIGSYKFNPDKIKEVLE